MKVCWKCAHPQAIQDAGEFVSSLEQMWRNVALYHLLTSGSSSEWVPSEWESNHHSNPHDFSLSVNILWTEMRCVCKKQIYH